MWLHWGLSTGFVRPGSPIRAIGESDLSEGLRVEPFIGRWMWLRDGRSNSILWKVPRGGGVFKLKCSLSRWHFDSGSKNVP